jgi:cytidylate kinase
MRAPLLVVVTGLPASGKTTVGRIISEQMKIPLIDKDDILEALIDSLGCEDRAQRHRLSRASDEVLFKLAQSSAAAVLVNWWDQDTAPARLRGISSQLIEVFCDCPLEIAARRFDTRDRHPGHLDGRRSPEEVRHSLETLRASYRGPLNLSANTMQIDTTVPLDPIEVAARVRVAAELSKAGE